MQQVWVRFAEEKDKAEFMDWVEKARAINLFDPDVLSYPNAKVLVAHNGSPLLYMPIQMAVIMESLAPKPGISEIEEALALREIAKATAVLASQAGSKEIYFLCKDTRVTEFAERHGFEILPWTTLRKKI